jgi:hypothetical protein
LATEGEVTGR